jgi:hypothetical protein
VGSKLQYGKFLIQKVLDSDPIATVLPIV